MLVVMFMFTIMLVTATTTALTVAITMLCLLTAAGSTYLEQCAGRRRATKRHWTARLPYLYGTIHRACDEISTEALECPDLVTMCAEGPLTAPGVGIPYSHHSIIASTDQLVLKDLKTQHSHTLSLRSLITFLLLLLLVIIIDMSVSAFSCVMHCHLTCISCCAP
jgi:hypothetical protein